MREFFIGNGPLIVGVIGAIEILLAALLWRRQRKTGDAMTLCLAVLCTGLVYDAAIIALGRVIPEGALPVLSQLRYVVSGLMIPLLLPMCGYALRWSKKLMIPLWILTALLMAAGAAGGFAERLAPMDFAGILRYVSTDETPAWASTVSSISTFGAVIPLIVTGIFVLIREKLPHVLLAGLLMFAFSALAPATGNIDLIFMMSMIGEALMVLFLFLHILAAAKKDAEK